jgi:hypothetical protein
MKKTAPLGGPSAALEDDLVSDETALSHDEMVALLEEIARDESKPAGARVTAIRTLWEWRRVEPEEGPTGFDELYAADELPRPPAGA